MRIKLEARPAPSTLMRVASPLIALALTALVGLALFIALGIDPWSAFYTFIVSPISDRYGVGEWLLKASPLILIALGLAVGFRSNVWNIGAEGQLTLGVIFGGFLALRYSESDSSLLLPAMVIAGAIGGALWASIVAALRTRFNANEILVSLMLTYIAQLWLSYLVYGPWRDPAGFNFPQSKPLGEAALFPIILDGTRLNASIFIAIAAVAAVWVLFNRSFLGFRLRVTGEAPAAAAYAGFNANTAVWIGMLAGGVAAGSAGVGEIAGPLGQIFPTASPGYGFAAIIVAFVGRLNPIGIVLAGLLMSLLYLSGEAAQLELNLPSSITGLFQGTLLLFLLGAEILVNYRVRFMTTKLAPQGAAL